MDNDTKRRLLRQDSWRGTLVVHLLIGRTERPPLNMKPIGTQPSILNMPYLENIYDPETQRYFDEEKEREAALRHAVYVGALKVVRHDSDKGDSLYNWHFNPFEVTEWVKKHRDEYPDFPFTLADFEDAPEGKPPRADEREAMLNVIACLFRLLQEPIPKERLESLRSSKKAVPLYSTQGEIKKALEAKFPDVPGIKDRAVGGKFAEANKRLEKSGVSKLKRQAGESVMGKYLIGIK